jgi:hypothetical protein
LDLAAVDEDALHRLWDAMAPDLLRAETCHEAHDETPTHRDDDSNGTKSVRVGRDQVDTEPLEVQEVGEEPDHVEERKRDTRSEHADHYRQRNEPQDGRRRGEVPEHRFGWPPGTPIETPGCEW